MIIDHIVLFPFLISFLVTAITTPFCITYLKKLGIVDDPKRHKHPAILHTQITPRGGGIPMYVGILVAGIIFLPVTQITMALFLASFIALAIGVVDDKLDVSPYLRFFINILTAFIVVGSGITISYVTNPVGGILHLNQLVLLPIDLPREWGVNPLLLSNIVSVIWIVWVMNMLNWSKGVDGQMPGIVAISAIVIGLVSMRFPLADQNTYIAAILSFMIAGSSLGFLLFNFYPAKIFPGYGATSIYLLLAAVSILSGAKLATALLVMGVPMIDGIFTIGRRILSGHSPFWHDKKHLHHLLLKLGLGHRSIALFYWILSAILGVISLGLSSREKAFALLMIIIIVGGAILSLHLALRSKNEKEII